MLRDLKEKSRISVVLFFFTTLAIVGVIGVGFIVSDYAKARGSFSWMVVEGVVLSERKGDGLRYVYSVNGHTYEGTRQRLFTARMPFRKEQTDHAPGDKIDVFVSPKDPSYSILEQGGSGIVFACFFLFSGACVFVGVGGIVRTLETTVSGDFIAENEGT